MSLKDKIKQLIDASSVDDVKKITGSVVKEAACSMKPDKSDISEGFSSDCLLHAPDILFNLTASIFQSWVIHGKVTLSLLCCAFLPLIKSSLKDPTKTDSYRAIAGSSLFLELF